VTDKERIAAARPLFDSEDIAEIADGIGEVLRGGRLILGSRLREVERAFAARVGVAHAVGVSSCTAALEITFRHLDVRGREVIVPTNTFVATAAAVLAAGGRPVFCDVDSSDWGLDVDDALSRVTPETAAIVVVHIAGMIASGTDRLREECRRRGLMMIEDCAHAHGARSNGREAGSLGDVGCFSFYPTKVLTCGVGGMITTDDPALATTARSLRHHGQGDSLEQITRLGNDWVLDEIHAVVLSNQLSRLDERLSWRRALASRYDERLANESVDLPRPLSGSEPAWYKYPILLPHNVDGKEVRARFLEEHDIEVGSLYSPPVHLMPAIQDAVGTGPGMLPKAEELLPRQITLPMHASLTEDDVDRSVEALQVILH
jgi:perosamine synthetase